MVGIMERFEVVGRGVLEMALHPAPSTGGSSQPQTFNPQKPYPASEAPHPTAPYTASSNPPHPLYAPPTSQAPESYSAYLDFNDLEFLANHSS